VHEGGLFKRGGEALLGQIDRASATSTLAESAKRARGSVSSATISSGAPAGGEGGCNANVGSVRCSSCSSAGAGSEATSHGEGNIAVLTSNDSSNGSSGSAERSGSDDGSNGGSNGANGSVEGSNGTGSNDGCSSNGSNDGDSEYSNDDGFDGCRNGSRSVSSVRSSRTAQVRPTGSSNDGDSEELSGNTGNTSPNNIELVPPPELHEQLAGFNERIEQNRRLLQDQRAIIMRDVEAILVHLKNKEHPILSQKGAVS